MTCSSSSGLYIVLGWPKSSEIRMFAGNVRNLRVFKLAGFGIGSLCQKSGEMHEQIRDQAFDAGNVLDGAGRRARGYQGVCRARQRRASAILLEQEGKEEDQRSHP